MQVHLEPVDWSKLTRFPSAEAFIEWVFENDGDATPNGYEPPETLWMSDSALQYFEVAEALDHVQQFVDPGTAENLRRGIRRVLCENGHVDDFGTGPASDNHTWISASPETTVTSGSTCSGRISRSSRKSWRGILRRRAPHTQASTAYSCRSSSNTRACSSWPRHAATVCSGTAAEGGP